MHLEVDYHLDTLLRLRPQDVRLLAYPSVSFCKGKGIAVLRLLHNHCFSREGRQADGTCLAPQICDHTILEKYCAGLRRCVDPLFSALQIGK